MKTLLPLAYLTAAGILSMGAPAMADNAVELYDQCMAEMEGVLSLSCSDIFTEGGVLTGSGEILYQVKEDEEEGKEEGGMVPERLPEAYDAPGSFPENEVLVWNSGLWKVYRVEERYMCYATTPVVSASLYAPLDTGTAIIEGDMELNLQIPQTIAARMEDEARLTADFFPAEDEAEAHVEAQGKVLVNGGATLFVVPLPPNEDRALEQALLFGYFFQEGDIINVSFDTDGNGKTDTIVTYSTPEGGDEAKRQLRLCVDGM